MLKDICKSFEGLQGYGAFLLRISMGILFIAHGLILKVMTFGVAGTVGYFESIGFPGFIAYVVIMAEIGGGLLLLAGFLTRIVSLGLIPLMIGATMQHISNGWVFSAEGGGWEFPAFWAVLLLVQALIGPGKFALGNIWCPFSLLEKKA